MSRQSTLGKGIACRSCITFVSTRRRGKDSMLQVQCSPLQTLLAISVGRMNGWLQKIARKKPATPIFTVKTRSIDTANLNSHRSSWLFSFCKPRNNPSSRLCRLHSNRKAGSISGGQETSRTRRQLSKRAESQRTKETVHENQSFCPC